MAVPCIPILHGLLCVPDCLEGVQALVQQKRRIVDQHVDEPHEGGVVLGIGALDLDGRLVDGVLPELLQDHTDVVADAELVEEFIRTTHTLTVWWGSVSACVCVWGGGGGGGGCIISINIQSAITDLYESYNIIWKIL